MIFFELHNIETMLNQTHDPIADFVNAVTADAIDFASSRTFEEFKDDSEALNKSATYTNLTDRSHRIGYQINKVVYRGYIASEALQTMHDGAIEARTQLKLASETEVQAQELADIRLARESQRAEKERESRREEAVHERDIERLQHKSHLLHSAELLEAELNATRQKNAIELEHQQSSNEQRIRFLGGVRELQVDLTRYLVARYQHPDRLIRVIGDSQPSVHLHDEHPQDPTDRTS